jgi:hypothetical protein
MTDHEFEMPRAKQVPVDWPELAANYVSTLEAEVKASPKLFYGNPATPATGGDRVRAALAVIARLKTRLEAINRS